MMVEKPPIGGFCSPIRVEIGCAGPGRGRARCPGTLGPLWTCPRAQASVLYERLAAFLDERAYPLSEDGYQEELRRSGNHHLAAAVLEKLKGVRRR